ncbi:MAG: hypothetical protein V4634_15900 [Pseudomonadota bacterium]
MRKVDEYQRIISLFLKFHADYNCVKLLHSSIHAVTPNKFSQMTAMIFADFLCSTTPAMPHPSAAIRWIPGQIAYPTVQLVHYVGEGNRTPANSPGYAPLIFAAYGGAVRCTAQSEPVESDIEAQVTTISWEKLA